MNDATHTQRWRKQEKKTKFYFIVIVCIWRIGNKNSHTHSKSATVHTKKYREVRWWCHLNKILYTGQKLVVNGQSVSKECFTFKSAEQSNFYNPWFFSNNQNQLTNLSKDVNFILCVSCDISNKKYISIHAYSHAHTHSHIDINKLVIRKYSHNYLYISVWIRVSMCYCLSWALLLLIYCNWKSASHF